MIVLGESDEQIMQTKCSGYSVIGTAMVPLSRPTEWLPIYYCRGFKWPLKEVWPDLKHWD